MTESRRHPLRKAAEQAADREVQRLQAEKTNAEVGERQAMREVQRLKEENEELRKRSELEVLDAVKKALQEHGVPKLLELNKAQDDRLRSAEEALRLVGCKRSWTRHPDSSDVLDCFNHPGFAPCARCAHFSRYEEPTT